jgi:TPR repeat protein
MKESFPSPSVLQSAEGGDAAAQCTLGLYYFDRAHIACEAHPEQDSGNGYCEWGAFWDDESLGEALKWLTYSAEQGFAEGQFHLAESYRALVHIIDETIDHNMFYTDHTYSWSELVEDYDFEKVYGYFNLACKWYKAAAKGGYRSAKKALAELEGNSHYRLDQDELDELEYEHDEGRYHGEV